MGLGSGRDSSESRFSTYVEALTGHLDMLTAQNVGRLSVGKLHQARAEKTSNSCAPSSSSPSCGVSSAGNNPDFAVSDRELVHEERPNDRHRVTALLAVPECTHVLVAFPLRDRIPRIWIILISKEPLTLQPFRFSTNFKGFLEGCLESIPLPGKNFTPNDPHVHFSTPPIRGLAAYDAVPIGHLPVRQLTG